MPDAWRIRDKDRQNFVSTNQMIENRLRNWMKCRTRSGDIRVKSLPSFVDFCRAAIFALAIPLACLRRGASATAAFSTAAGADAGRRG